MRRLCLLSLLLLAALAATPFCGDTFAAEGVGTHSVANVSPRRLRLVVRNGALSDQADAPVTVGVPWPAGALQAPDALRLLDAAGKELPLQTEVLSRWPDGSVKWALLDFQATARRNATVAFWLDYGADARAAAPAPSPLGVREDESLVTVATGAATFRVSKKRFALFDEVTLEGQERPIVTPYTESDGLSLDAAEEIARVPADGTSAFVALPERDRVFLGRHRAGERWFRQRGFRVETGGQESGVAVVDASSDPEGKESVAGQGWCEGPILRLSRAPGAPVEVIYPRAAARPKAFLSSLGPARVEVETRGPVRCVVRVAGKFQAADGAVLGDYIARLHFYAGLPAARLQLTLLNREKMPLSEGTELYPLLVSDATVRLPLRLSGLLRWQFLGETRRRDVHPGSLRNAADHAELVQHAALSGGACRYRVTQRGTLMAAGRIAGGGASLWGAAAGAAVAVRHMAASNPRSLRVLGRPRLEIGLLPEEAGPCEEFFAGRAITSDLMFWFSPGQPPSPLVLAGLLDEPLTAWVAGSNGADPPGQWYAASGVLPLAPLGNRGSDLVFLADFDRLLERAAADGAWGVWRHGGPLVERVDPALALGREFLRRGDPRLLDAAHVAARHLADVATFHNVAGGDLRLTGACREPVPPRAACYVAPLSPESWCEGAWLVGLLTGDRAVLHAALKNAAFATRHADDPHTAPLAAALAVLNLAHAVDVAPLLSPDDTASFQAALDAHLSRLLDSQRLGGHGLHDDSGPFEGIALEALALCQSRKADERIPPSMLRAAETLARPSAFWAGHEKVGGLLAADGAAAKRYGTADGLVADWTVHPDAAVFGLPCSLAPPWLAAIGESAGDTRFLKKARRLERVAACFPCTSPLDFALRYRQGDLFAAAWERHAASRPPGGAPAIGLQCRLECAADVALPDTGVGGAVLFRPFVTLPDGTRAYHAQSPDAADRPDMGLWFPAVDSDNLNETQGAIEFRIRYRNEQGKGDAAWLASGDLFQHGFALTLRGTRLELASRSNGGVTLRALADDVRPAPDAWHHVAVAWNWDKGLDLYFDGRKVAHSVVGRPAFAPHLRFPCNTSDKLSDYVLRDLRIWKRPPESFAAASDHTPPAAVTDLLLAPAEEGRMLLSWTAPGNDGRQGRARRYDIRVASEPFRPLSWGAYDQTGDPPAAIHWAEADRIAAPAPAPAGQLEKLLVGPFPRDRRVYLALRTEDDANVSPLSNVVHSGVNHAPVAVAGQAVRQAIVGSRVVFDGRGSSDPDGDDLTYAWSNGLQGAVAERVYDAPGNHEVTLTVSDGKLTATAATRLAVGNTVRVNFQPRRLGAVPEGFVPDEGAVYSKARGYGWRAVPPGTRGFSTGQPLPLEAATGLIFPSPAEWRLDLPNGAYKVTLAVGDPANLGGRRRVFLQGSEAANVDLAGQKPPVILTDLKATVSDGQLHLRLGAPADPAGSALGGGEIAYVIVQRVP